MFKKERKVEVVSPREYTDFSNRLKGNATKRTLIAAAIPLSVSVPLAMSLTSAETYTASPTFIPVSMSSPEVIQTGVMADKSLEAIANVMEPLINILVAVSFPVASVIMVGACFFFMFGNSEKAWSMIMNAGLGYVLIQMSPLFLNMLRTVGEAV